jgi:cytochrome c oxidase subunit 4
MPVLLILMCVKFFIVVSYFMHLKFDNKLFSFMFYSGLFLAIGVYAAFLATFKFFTA